MINPRVRVKVCNHRLNTQHKNHILLVLQYLHTVFNIKQRINLLSICVPLASNIESIAQGSWGELHKCKNGIGNMIESEEKQ